MRTLLLTGGGHVDFYSGLSTVISGGRERGYKIFGSLDGWDGIEKSGDRIVNLTHYPIERLRNAGGSFIGSSRTKPDLQRVKENLKRYNIDAIVAFGGDDTLRVATELYNLGIPVVGWPKTMDNDTKGSYATIGYTTAASRAAAATRESFDNAYAHSKVILLPLFGRDYDWVVLAAADYGHADCIIPAERDHTFDEVATQINFVRHENGIRYGRQFAVVAVSEGASGLEGLEEYVRKWSHGKVSYDKFGHPKLEPEIVGLALKDGLGDSGINRDVIALKALTYHLRDGKLVELDEVFARKTAEECIRLLEQGNFGRVATVQDPRISGFWPDAQSLYIDAHGTPLVVSSVPLKEAATKRPVNETGFMDYKNLRPTVASTQYLSPLLGSKPENPRDNIKPFEVASPAETELVHAL